jgi:chromosome segregation protein
LKQLTKMPGVVGWATELVDYDPHIREAANYLLGNTLVVEHLDVALLLEKKGIRIKFVTLDGDLINPSGAMSGGSYRASGLLSRESEITGLVEATEVLARQLVELDADLDRLESSVANYRKLIAELNEKSTELQISLANSVKDAETHEKAAQERKERFENFKEEFDNAQDEKTAYEDQVKLNQANIKDIDKQIEEHKKRTAEFSNAMSSRTEAINKLGDEIQELKIQLAQQEERKTAATRSIERLESETGRQGEMLEQREKELKALEKEEKEARSEIEELEKRTKELTERHAKLEAELKAQSSDKQEKVAALQKLQEDQQAAQRERNILANDLHDADVKRTQKSAQMESLNMQAEEKFASSLDDLMASLESELTDLAENREETAEDDSDPQNEAEVISLEFDHDDPTAFVGTEGDATSGEATDAVDSDIEQTDEERAKWLDHPLAQLPLDTLQAEAQDLRDSIAALGPVNMQAIDDYERIEERLDFMSGQQKDLIAARDTILKTIQKIDETTTTMFRECYDAVRENFINNFRRLFGGGKADLILTNPDDLLTTGIEIIAQPPGKKPQTITLLSGGEKCLTAIGVMFALFQWKPSPICVLDEIDAPLDDANVERFKAMIKEFAASTQFIIISHNKLTMELADTIFGITMQDPGVSNVVSVQFDDIEASGLLEPNATQGGDDVQAKAG